MVAAGVGFGVGVLVGVAVVGRGVIGMEVAVAPGEVEGVGANRVGVGRVGAGRVGVGLTGRATVGAGVRVGDGSVVGDAAGVDVSVGGGCGPGVQRATRKNAATASSMAKSLLIILGSLPRGRVDKAVWVSIV